MEVWSKRSLTRFILNVSSQRLKCVCPKNGLIIISCINELCIGPDVNGYLSTAAKCSTKRLKSIERLSLISLCNAQLTACIAVKKSLWLFKDVARPKFAEAKYFDFSEQQFFLGEYLDFKRATQYFVWDTASQSTKWQDMLEIWGALAPLATPIWLFHQRRQGNQP